MNEEAQWLEGTHPMVERDRKDEFFTARGVDVAELRRRAEAFKANNESDNPRDGRKVIVLSPDDTLALLDAAEAVNRVTALADRHSRLSQSRPTLNSSGGESGAEVGLVPVRDLRAALVAPDNHNKETTP